MQDDDKNLDDTQLVSDEETPMTPDEGEAPVAESTETENSVMETPENTEAATEAEMPAESESVSAGSSTTATPAGTDDRGRTLYNVKCSNCGNDTTVPFMPAEGRPVYCRDCFSKMKNS